MQAGTTDLALFIISIATAFTSLLGLPPEPRDPVMIQAAPKDALVYLEWSPRGSGKLNGPEFEGLVADPEITACIQNVDASIRRMLVDILEGSEDANRLAKAIPEFQKMLLLQPGSLSLRFDQSLVGPAVQKLQEEGRELPVELQGIAGIEATLIVRMGENPDEMEQHITRTIKVATEGDVKTDKLERTEIPLKIPGMKIIFHRHQGYLIVSNQASGIDTAIAGIEGKDQGLSGQPRFLKSTEKVLFPQTGSLLWIDTKGIFNTMTTGFGLPGIMANGVVAMFGLEKIDSISCASGIEQGKIAVKHWADTQGQTAKALSLFSGSGIPESRFELIPHDADLVFAGSLDLPKTILEFEKLATAIGQKEKFDFLQEIDSELKEFDLTLAELLKPFADNVIVYDAPGSGGLLLSGPVLLLEVRDHERASSLLDRIVRLLREKLPPFDERSRGVLLSEGEFLGEKIFYLDQAVREPEVINPAFCLTKDSLIVGLHPQSIKGHLRMLGDKSHPRFGSRFSKGKEGFQVPAGKLLLVRYLNLQTVGRLLLPLLPYGEVQATSQLKMSRFDLSTFDFPSAAAILPYLKDHLSTVTRTEKGLLYHGEGSLPPQIVDTLLWLLPAAGAGVYDEMTFTPERSPEDQAISKVNPQGKKFEHQNKLELVGQGQ